MLLMVPAFATAPRAYTAVAAAMMTSRAPAPAPASAVARTA